MEIIVGRDVSFIAFGLEVGNRNANVVRRVATGDFLQVLDDRLQGLTRVENIIDEQQAVFIATVFDQVAQAVDSDLFFLSVNFAGVVAGSDGDVIRLDAEVLQEILNRDSHGYAASPQGDNKTGPETALDYLGS